MNYFNNIKINKSNLMHNLNIIKEKAKNKKICAMVKADAYGHGLKDIVLLLKNQVDFFGVANTEEALKVRCYTNKNGVLICGMFNKDKLINLLQQNISLTIFSMRDLQQVLKVCMANELKANIHIKINTGMNRFGVSEKQKFLKIIDVVNKNKNYIKLEGIYSHLFCAENEELSLKQYLRFMEFLNCIKKSDCINIHIESSMGLFKNIDKLNFCNMVRVGIALYGLSIEKENLKPVLKVESKIINIQKIKDEEYCGYGKEVVEANTLVAIIPLGYADGILRGYKNATVYVNDKPCRIVNVCMDVIMIDVTNCKAVVGDSVEIISINQQKQNSANKLARHLNTISYEVVTNLNHGRYNYVVD